MILINLLPHREAARRRRRESFYMLLGASALAGLVLGGLLYLTALGRVESQREQVDLLRSEISQLEGQIRDIANLQAEIAALRARQQAVENLQADRNIPVHVLNDLARLLPEGVYLTAVRQDNQIVSVSGVAQSNERVSEFLRQLGNASTALSRPELVEIVAGTINLSPRDQRRVANFTLRVSVNRGADAAPAASSPAAPAAAASAAALAVPVATRP